MGNCVHANCPQPLAAPDGHAPRGTPLSVLAQSCNTGAGVCRTRQCEHRCSGQIFPAAPMRGGGLSVFQSGGVGGCTLAPQTLQRGSGLPIQEVLPGIMTLGAGRPSIGSLFPSFATKRGNGLKSRDGYASTRGSLVGQAVGKSDEPKRERRATDQCHHDWQWCVAMRSLEMRGMEVNHVVEGAAVSTSGADHL